MPTTVTNKYSTTMKRLNKILEKVKIETITVEEAEHQVLNLFGVIKSDYCFCENTSKQMTIELDYYCERCGKIILQ